MNLLLFSLFILKISSSQIPTEDCVNVISPDSKTECQSIILDANVKCCFVEYKIGKEQFTRCVPMYDTKDGINQYKEMLHKVKKVSIVCSSIFEKINILMLLFILSLIF